ncbi:hypothetical protein [Streptomyces katrae]|uniref:Uncharacterized protein n=1 Tax=Streptomyces katrae TaxID=68223 RepID=A0A0F4JFL8_9ACTN|nr:hypothetical protein [Streptomyces katrae]KJY32985.1 hypothetical protein VR44_14795 [Streptomyces katrae]
MSYNQPGPYGQQPQQPGPYGQQPPPPPNPYGQQPQQPAYGYPQQAPPPAYPQPTPPPPPGYPQQGGYQTPPAPQPAYGYQQQPPQQGYMPPPAPPKKSKAGPIIAVIAVVAVIGGAGWWFLGGSGGVSDATKGYKLAFPAAVDSYQKAPDATGAAAASEAPLTGDKKTKAEALGVQNAHSANAKYQVGTDPKGKSLSASGLWGDIADPAKAIDNYYAGLSQNNPEAEKIGFKYEVVGTPKEFSPAGFKGAVMKCAYVKLVNLKPAATGKEPKEIQVPSCAWGDHSTLVGVNAIDPAVLLVGGSSGTLDEVAALAAKLYNTSRTKA